MLTKLKNLLQRDALFAAALVLALATSLWSRPQVAYIDWKVIFCLFDLMAIILVLGKMHLWDRVAVRMLSSQDNERWLSVLLIALTFVSSMLITNDVALITFVPLTILIAQKADFDPGYVVILQALAANIGSSLTPIGNPQNLFLFNHYSLTLHQLTTVMLPFGLMGAVWLVLLGLKVPSRRLEFDLTSVPRGNRWKTGLYLTLFALVILSVLRILDYRLVSVLVVVALLLLDRDVLVRVDYLLLGTFACFFVFIGNLSHFQAVTTLMGHLFDTAVSAYLSSILFSQAISNVPCAILLSHFTRQWQAVLLGVNVGGMGTLIASLASLIAYRYYVKSYRSQGYLSRFLGYNFVSLAFFSGLVYWVALR